MKTWRSYDEGSNAVPGDIAVDRSGSVYLAEAGRHRIAQYSPEGSLTTWWDLLDAETGVAGYPAAITVDASRTLYIADRRNDTIRKITLWKREIWGSEGTGRGQYSNPAGIALDSSGNVYVADTGNNRIQNLHSTGSWLLQWGSYGTQDGAFNAPGAVATDSHDNIYVADTGNSRVQKFTREGIFLAKWGTPGMGNGEFQAPSGIAVSSWGNIYIADHTSRVQEFSPAGDYISTCNTGGNTSDVAIGPSGAMYVLLQDGSTWMIKEFRIPSSDSAQTQENPRTFSVVTPRTTVIPTLPAAAVTAKNTQAAQVQPRKSSETATIAPDAFPGAGVALSLTPAAGDNATPGAPAHRSGEDVAVTGGQTGIFDRISGFLRDVFGGIIPFIQ